MKTKKLTRKQQRESSEAVQEMLQRNPQIREKVEQVRQARSRTDGREVSFDEMLGYLMTTGLESFERQWVYTAQLLCSNNHSVIMILGEYQDEAIAGTNLQSMLMKTLERDIPGQECPTCHSSEFHTAFNRTNFHTRAELEAAKAEWDSRLR